jgi:hypothetical protein
VSAVFFTTTPNHRYEVGVSTRSTHPHHPTKRARDKSVVAAWWIVMETQRVIGTRILSLASFIFPDRTTFNGLDASHRSEYAILHGG